MIEIVSELQETGIIQRVGGDLGELSGALADLGTWRLFAPANKAQLAGFSVRSGAGSAETGLVG